MKKIYFSSRFSRRLELLELKPIVEKHLNCEVIGAWLYGAQVSEKELVWNNPVAYEKADQNLSDIQCANEVWIFTDIPREGGKGGDKVELGYALALNKNIVVIGPPETCFHCIPDIRHVDHYSELLIT